MDTLTKLLLLSVCACSHSEPLAAALRRRSDGYGYGYGASAGDYNRDYEPYVFAAVPLHAPFPVLRVLSPVPLTAPALPALSAKAHRHSASFQHPVYARAPFDTEYVSSNTDYEFVYGEPNRGEPHKFYEPAYSKPRYQLAGLASEPEEAILYARPSPQGGYVYRKRPGSPKKPPKRKPYSSSPIIFRVHKYKIVKDDR